MVCLFIKIYWRMCDHFLISIRILNRNFEDISNNTVLFCKRDRSTEAHLKV
jgi:hypothetical protein